MWGLNPWKWAVQTGHCIEWASKARWTQRGGGRRRRGSYHNKAVLEHPSHRTSFSLGDPVDSDCPRSWICFPQSSQLARAAHFPAHSAKSMQITQPCLFSLQTHYNAAVLYGTECLAGLCLLPMLSCLMGIKGEQVWCIGLNAVTPVLCGFV